MGKNRLSKPQSEAFYAQEKSVGVVAGFGSGKTHGALSVAFDRIIDYPDIPLGYAAPTYRDIEDIWYPAVDKHCTKHGFKHWIHKSKHVIYVEGMAPIVCRSLSNPDAIVGFEVGDFLLDEMDILTMKNAMNSWRKCKARCRMKFPKKRIKLPFGGHTEKKRKKNQMFAFTTPEGFKATHALFKKKSTRLKNSKLIQMSTYSNLHNLPDDYIDELMANYPPQLVLAYIEGKFTNLTSGIVYPSFDRDLNNAPGIVEFSREVIHVGMDFNVRHMSAIIHVIRNGRPIAVGEIVNTLDTPNMIMAIKGLYPNNPVFVYPDATGSATSTHNASISDLKLLKAAGFRVVVDGTNPRIRDRVLGMNGMFLNTFGERRYLVNVDMCPVYVDNLEQQAYDEKTMLPDKKNNNDHTNDAGGYFINKRFGIIKPDAQAKRLVK